jgi:polysaccharide biosynthesis/export protein
VNHSRALFRQFLLVLASLMIASANMVNAQPAADTTTYHVGPRDILAVSVYGSPAYTGDVEVAVDGTIPVAEVGPVAVEGRTVKEIGDTLAQQFKSKGILINPIINVRVQQYRSQSVSVLGRVNRQGALFLDHTGYRLSDVIARAEGISGPGGAIVQVTRADGTRIDVPASMMTGAMDIKIQGGDSILVVQPTFAIDGEVQRPNNYDLIQDFTVARAVALAGGLTPRGSRKRIKITRIGENGVRREMQAKPGDPVMPGDIIMIGARIF